MDQFHRELAELNTRLARIESSLKSDSRDHPLHHLEHRIMAAIDDLKAAITDLGTQLSTNNDEIEKLLNKIASSQGGTSDADVQAAVQSIRDLITANKAEVDKAVQAVP